MGEKEADKIQVSFDLFVLFVVMALGVFTLYSQADNPDTVTSYATLSDITGDGQIDEQEEAYLSSLDCEELKELLGTNKSACIYFTSDGENVEKIGEELFAGCGDCPVPETRSG